MNQSGVYTQQMTVQRVVEKLDKWRTKEEVAGLEKLPTADEQSLKVIFSRNRKESSNDLTQDLRDASLKPYQKLS